MNNDAYIAIKERLNESKCAAERARQLANKALDECKLREDAYAAACHRVRELERLVDDTKRGFFVKVFS